MVISLKNIVYCSVFTRTQLPSGAGVDALTTNSHHLSERDTTPHDEVELLADRDVEELSKQLEKERWGYHRIL